MNLKCIYNGHEYEKIRTTYLFDMDDMHHSTNDVFRCKRCLKIKYIPTGKLETH